MNKLEQIRKAMKVVKGRFSKVTPEEKPALQDGLDRLEDMEIEALYAKLGLSQDIEDWQAIKMLDDWANEGFRKVEVVYLEGSEKQVAWAEDIREKAIRETNKVTMCADATLVLAELENVQRKTRYLASITSAKWFIENRGMFSRIAIPVDFE